MKKNRFQRQNKEENSVQPGATRFEAGKTRPKEIQQKPKKTKKKKKERKKENEKKKRRGRRKGKIKRPSPAIGRRRLMTDRRRLGAALDGSFSHARVPHLRRPRPRPSTILHRPVFFFSFFLSLDSFLFISVPSLGPLVFVFQLVLFCFVLFVFFHEKRKRNERQHRPRQSELEKKNVLPLIAVPSLLVSRFLLLVWCLVSFLSLCWVFFLKRKRKRNESGTDNNSNNISNGFQRIR